MLILCWWYDDLLYITYTWKEKIYDSDDLPLTQMVIKHNSEVNDADKNAEDEEDDANFSEMSDEGSNEGKFLFVVDIESLR